MASLSDHEHDEDPEKAEGQMDKLFQVIDEIKIEVKANNNEPVNQSVNSGENSTKIKMEASGEGGSGSNKSKSISPLTGASGSATGTPSFILKN